MRKLIIIAAVAFAAVNSFGASKAATEAWVTNKIAVAVQPLTVTRTNGNATVYHGRRIDWVVDDRSVPSVRTYGATAAAVALGVTNNMYFIWHETTHSYTNHAQEITATATNLVWRGISSDGSAFPGYFGVNFVMLQPGVAKEVTK